MYEIRKMDDFVNGFFCDHTAVLAHNYLFEPGKAWRVTGWWASRNAGTAASDPSMLVLFDAYANWMCVVGAVVLVAVTELCMRRYRRRASASARAG